MVGLFSSKASAREGAGEWFEHQWQWAWLESYDPTLISRRVLTELSWEDSGDAESLTKLETSVRWAIPIREDLAFAIQGLVPLKWLDSAADRQFGLGDFEVRPGIVCRASRDLRFGFGVNAAFDTAPSSGLGSTVLELRPIAGVRWDASERINLGLNAEYGFTPCDEGKADVSAFELKFPVVLKVDDAWSAALTYKPRWNLLNQEERHRLEAGATYLWGSELQYALSFGAEVPLASERFDYKWVSGFGWFF